MRVQQLDNSYSHLRPWCDFQGRIYQYWCDGRHWRDRCPPEPEWGTIYRVRPRWIWQWYLIANAIILLWITAPFALLFWTPKWLPLLAVIYLGLGIISRLLIWLHK
jgi:hypothetical protein